MNTLAQYSNYETLDIYGEEDVFNQPFGCFTLYLVVLYWDFI